MGDETGRIVRVGVHLLAQNVACCFISTSCDHTLSPSVACGTETASYLRVGSCGSCGFSALDHAHGVEISECLLLVRVLVHLTVGDFADEFLRADIHGAFHARIGDVVRHCLSQECLLKLNHGLLVGFGPRRCRVSVVDDVGWLRKHGLIRFQNLVKGLLTSAFRSNLEISLTDLRWPLVFSIHAILFLNYRWDVTVSLLVQQVTARDVSLI